MKCFLAPHLVRKRNPIGKSTTGVPSQVGDLHQPVGGFILPIQIFPPKRGDLGYPQNLAYLGPWLDLLTIGTSTTHISMQIHKYTKIVKHTSMIYSFPRMYGPSSLHTWIPMNVNERINKRTVYVCGTYNLTVHDKHHVASGFSLETCGNSIVSHQPLLSKVGNPSFTNKAIRLLLGSPGASLGHGNAEATKLSDVYRVYDVSSCVIWTPGSSFKIFDPRQAYPRQIEKSSSSRGQSKIDLRNHHHHVSLLTSSHSNYHLVSPRYTREHASS